MIIEMREHRSVSVALPEATARRLGDVSREAVTVAPERAPGRWQLTAGSHVGSLAVDGVQILIRPKVHAENVFLFLGAGLPHAAWRAEAFDYGTTHDLLPAVLSFFARTVETTLGRGVLRSYRAREERLVALRGRIDFPAQMRRAGLVTPVDCRYDDYTADIDENRYLRAGLRRALRASAVPAVDRRRMLQALVALEDVADLDVPPDTLDRIPESRLNAQVFPALRLARVVLENLTLVDVQGAHAASAFLVDMNTLFERFLTQRLTGALRGTLQVRRPRAPIYLDRGRTVPLYPDLEFRRGGIPVYVGDIKYKLTDGARARAEDHYQLLAYTRALDLPEGVLIYCRDRDGVVGSSAAVVHGGTLLHTRAIDAGAPPAALVSEIDGLAGWIADRCAGLTSAAPALSPKLVPPPTRS